MNIFEYIQAYIDKSSTGLYGDFLGNNDKKDKIEDLFDNDNDRIVYRQLKLDDKNRLLINSGQTSKNYNKLVNANQYGVISGIGMVRQIC
ncbi:MAG: hypothetical protein J6D03_00045 [Clostridia bacterium]|nr:hypothetical protein [Clostridia bacterium]